MGAVTLELPYPPTVNHYWEPIYKRAGLKRFIAFKITSRGRNFRGEVAARALSVKIKAKAEGLAIPVPAPVALTAFVHPPDRRVRDLDNILKPLLDSLEHCGMVDNDADISTLIVKRGKFVQHGQVMVTLSTALVSATCD